MTTKKTPAKSALALDAKSKWRARVEESRGKDAEFKKSNEPYVYHGVSDGFAPVNVYPPRTVEQFMVLARVNDPNVPLSDGEMRDVLRIICGEEAFPKIWDDIKDEHVSLMFALIEELNESFAGTTVLPAESEVADVPGGA